MSDLIDRTELIKALNKVAMEHHERHVPLVEHDFRELIHQAKRVNEEVAYEAEITQERKEMGAEK